MNYDKHKQDFQKRRLRIAAYLAAGKKQKWIAEKMQVSEGRISQIAKELKAEA